ncbi:MAG: hypothetical protein MI861_24920, partial [Pirellulales bacterium]|nr:hypothetical protein [Pirellulales bacterium]
MSIEPFTIILALLPLIGYLIVLGLIRVSGRALVTTGGRDIAALAIAISGLLAVGPAELFFPVPAATVFGPVVWVALATFYGLCVTLIVLTSTPRLVVYGRTPEELFEPLLHAVRQIDPAATGDLGALAIILPSLKINLRIDGQRGVDYAQVLAFEANVSVRFWSTLLRHLRATVQTTAPPMPRRGFLMLLVATLLASILAWQGFGNQELVVEGFREWL